MSKKALSHVHSPSGSLAVYSLACSLRAPLVASGYMIQCSEAVAFLAKVGQQ